jgi:hypothetical protein
MIFKDATTAEVHEALAAWQPLFYGPEELYRRALARYLQDGHAWRVTENRRVRNSHADVYVQCSSEADLSTDVIVELKADLKAKTEADRALGQLFDLLSAGANHVVGLFCGATRIEQVNRLYLSLKPHVAAGKVRTVVKAPGHLTYDGPSYAASGRDEAYVMEPRIGAAFLPQFGKDCTIPASYDEMRHKALIALLEVWTVRNADRHVRSAELLAELIELSQQRNMPISRACKSPRALAAALRDPVIRGKFAITCWSGHAGLTTYAFKSCRQMDPD